MEIQIPYGQKDRILIRVDRERVAGIVRPNETARVDHKIVLQKALQEPIDSQPFDQFLEGAGNVLVMVNDATRPTPTAKILETIAPNLEGLAVRFLVATGSHREPTREECEQIFGTFYSRYRQQIDFHRARLRQNMVVVGTTSRGTEMAINRLAAEADRLVVIGSVEPHYFAGFTGGRKSFLPGIASYQTIEHNHSFALQREAHTLALDGNPVHEDMVEAVTPLLDKKIFAIMAIVNTQGGIYNCTAGHLLDCFYPATQMCREVFVVQIPEKADVVVTVAPFPTDINLFQSHKALENGKLALKDDGIIILVSACRAGLGDDTFARLLNSSKSPQDALHKIQGEYRLGYHKAAKIAETSLWAQIWAMTGLEDSVLEGLFFRPIHDLQEAIDRALAARGPQSKVLFLPQGSLTVPSV